MTCIADDSCAGDKDWMAFEVSCCRCYTVTASSPPLSHSREHQGGLQCKALLQPELQPLSHVCIIRGSTHQIMLDAPNDLAEIMLEWIASGGSRVGNAAVAPSPRT
jgi:hypothetical protein